jgi:hypothetical protein
MKITDYKQIKNKDLVVFDLDGTLAPSKSVMDQEMAKLIKELLTVKKVAVIGGGKLELFKHQFLNELKVPESLLKNLYLFPTTATTFLRYQNGWEKVYSHDLTKEQIERIRSAFKEVFAEIKYKKPEKTYGKVIENRGTQVTWSALGQDIVATLGSKKGIEIKNKWRDENMPLKLKISKALQKRLPDLEVLAAGHTSIDITKKGIDKSYGLKQIEKYLKIKIGKMLFLGDAIFPGGNDYAITKTPIDYVYVKDPEDTKKVIKQVLGIN